MKYNIFREIAGVGTRFLAAPTEPFQWVISAADAYEFTDPISVIRNLPTGLQAQYMEVHDSWAGPNNR